MELTQARAFFNQGKCPHYGILLRFPPQTSGLLETSEDTSAVPWETGVVTSTITNEANVVPEETSVATTLAGVSIAVDASLHTSGPISVDLCSFGEL